MKPFAYATFCFAVIYFSSPSFGMQTEQSVRDVNARIILKLDEILKLQEGSRRGDAVAVRERLAPYLNVNDIHLAQHLLDLVENEFSADSFSFTRFIVLNGLWDIGSLEDTEPFDRLLAYFESETTSMSDRTSASNSIRAAGIRSNNPLLLEKIRARVEECTSAEALAEYIFYLGQEVSLLNTKPWYFPFLIKNLRNYETSPAVRAASAYELGKVDSRFFSLSVTSDIARLIQQNLLAAAEAESNLEVRHRIINAMGMSRNAAYAEFLIRVKASDPDVELRGAADSALFALRAGFVNSNVISPFQKIANLRARVLGRLDHLRNYCSSLLK